MKKLPQDSNSNSNEDNNDSGGGSKTNTKSKAREVLGICGICGEPMHEDDSSVLDCGHRFHDECICHMAGSIPETVTVGALADPLSYVVRHLLVQHVRDQKVIIIRCGEPISDVDIAMACGRLVDRNDAKEKLGAHQKLRKDIAAERTKMSAEGPLRSEIQRLGQQLLRQGEAQRENEERARQIAERAAAAKDSAEREELLRQARRDYQDRILPQWRRFTMKRRKFLCMNLVDQLCGRTAVKNQHKKRWKSL